MEFQKINVFTFFHFLLYWRIYFSSRAMGSVKSSSTDYNESNKTNPKSLAHIGSAKSIVELRVPKNEIFHLFSQLLLYWKVYFFTLSHGLIKCITNIVIEPLLGKCPEVVPQQQFWEFFLIRFNSIKSVDGVTTAFPFWGRCSHREAFQWKFDDIGIVMVTYISQIETFKSWRLYSLNCDSAHFHNFFYLLPGLVYTTRIWTRNMTSFSGFEWAVLSSFHPPSSEHTLPSDSIICRSFPQKSKLSYQAVSPSGWGSFSGSFMIQRGPFFYYFVPLTLPLDIWPA